MISQFSAPLAVHGLNTLNGRTEEDIQELAKQVGEETARGFVQFTQE